MYEDIPPVHEQCLQCKHYGGINKDEIRQYLCAKAVDDKGWWWREHGWTCNSEDPDIGAGDFFEPIGELITDKWNQRIYTDA